MSPGQKYFFIKLVIFNYVGCPNYVGNKFDSMLENPEQELDVPLN
jgi:hypothetical protein